MNGEANRVVKHYKAQHPESVLLFRVKNSYVAYGEDVSIISQQLCDSKLNFIKHTSAISFPSKDVYEYMSAIGNSGREIRLIEYRDDNGEFTLPDITRLHDEQDADY